MLRPYKYIGVFKNGHTIEVSCKGFVQAFYLLTADAIRSGKNYELSTITDENGIIRNIDNDWKECVLIK